MPKKRKPSYLLHKPTGQARVRIDGRDVYLGLYGSAESRDRYDEIVLEWLSRNGDTSASTLTVDDLALLYLDHAKKHYRKNGKPTSEVDCIRLVLRHLVKVHGQTRVLEFGPKALKAVRQSMIDAGYVRSSINIHVSRIRQMFRWAVAEQFVPVDILTALQSLPGLRANRSEAREAKPVKPVPREQVDAVRPFVSPPVWAMVQLQVVTGMRPGEVIVMRAIDLKMAGPIWEYTPESHKTEHHGKGRIILLGPRAQAVIRPFLAPNLNDYLFRPTDVRPAQKGGSRQPGEHYCVDAYRNAVKRACEKAFDMPKELRTISKKVSDSKQQQLKRLASEWRREHCWHPHQLRHNAATELRREFGIEAARVILGHSSAATTEIYAEMDLQRAREVVSAVG